VGRLVIFGGFGAGKVLNDTWSWDGSTWMQEQPAHSPSARTSAQLAFDGTNLLLYGGFDGHGTVFGDTWRWDGADWTQLTPVTSPPPINAGAMTYDPLHHQVVLFGGSTGGGVGTVVSANIGVTLAETWTWDGTTWTQQHPAHSPPAIAQESMIFHPDLGGVVMFNGGTVNATDFDLTGTKGFYNNQLWLWDGTDWTQRFTTTVPGPRGAESFAYDGGRHALVLYGGNGVHGIQGDTWTLLPPPVQLVSVLSRKVHGSAGTFDVDLPLTGPRGIECRSGGANNDYTLVFTFTNTLTSVASANVSSGTGTVSSSAIDSSDAHQYIVNLTGVTNAQYIAATLTNVTDSAGNSSISVPGPSMGVLIGDVNASGIVTSGDTNLCKAQALQPVTNANFRNDINASGAITTGDVNIIKQNALTQLPTPP
jgi:hypothetical protein